MGNSLLITGAPATGKTTLQLNLLNTLGQYVTGLDYTTRPMREGEINGVNRHFVTKSEFVELFLQGYFVERNLEDAHYNGEFYGTPKNLASEDPNKISVITGLEVAKSLKKLFPNTFWIHLYAQQDELLIRLEQREKDRESILYRLNPDNSDPGTFTQVSSADLNVNSGKYSVQEIVEIVTNLLNSQEQ